MQFILGLIRQSGEQRCSSNPIILTDRPHPLLSLTPFQLASEELRVSEQHRLCCLIFFHNLRSKAALSRWARY